MKMDENIFGRYTINLDEIVNNKIGLTSHTVELAKKLIQQPYMIPGDYFKYLPKDQLEYIQEICNKEDAGEETENLDEVVLIVLMLLYGEGILPETQEEIADALSFFKMMIAGVGLQRKNLINIRYENISFGGDVLDQSKIIFEKKENPDETI